MTKEIILSPEQLYYMGRLMQAQYIDYAYVAAMPGIDGNFALFEAEAKAALVASGVLVEDFGGNVEIDPAVLSVLRPVFFGETETTVELIDVVNNGVVTSYRFHFHDGATTQVTARGGKFVVSAADDAAVRAAVEGIVPAAYTAEPQTVETVDGDKVSRAVSFKRVRVGATPAVLTYIEADGTWYSEQDGVIHSVTRDAFIADAYDVVKGV